MPLYAARSGHCQRFSIHLDKSDLANSRCARSNQAIGGIVLFKQLLRLHRNTRREITIPPGATACFLASPQNNSKTVYPANIGPVPLFVGFPSPPAIA